MWTSCCCRFDIFLISINIHLFPKGGKIDVSNVDAILKNMDIKLTEEEQQYLLDHLSATGEALK